jgi:hypothetical protein
MNKRVVRKKLFITLRKGDLGHIDTLLSAGVQSVRVSLCYLLPELSPLASSQKWDPRSRRPGDWLTGRSPRTMYR